MKVYRRCSTTNELLTHFLYRNPGRHRLRMLQIVFGLKTLGLKGLWIAINHFASSIHIYIFTNEPGRRPRCRRVRPAEINGFPIDSLEFCADSGFNLKKHRTYLSLFELIRCRRSHRNHREPFQAITSELGKANSINF